MPKRKITVSDSSIGNDTFQYYCEKSGYRKKIDLTKFENIPLLMEYFDSIRPEAAENAAMHKLQEMRDQMTADVSIAMKESYVKSLILHKNPAEKQNFYWKRISKKNIRKKAKTVIFQNP